MNVGNEVRTAIALPGIPAGTPGTVKEIGRLFVLVAFEDGRQGYYAPHQLTSVITCPEGKKPGESGLICLGIANVRLPRGSHSCLLPSSENSAVNATARFVSAGLLDGETIVGAIASKQRGQFLRCLRQLGVDADLVVRQGRLAVTTPSRLYLKASEFSSQRQLERTANFIAAASKENPKGVRCFGYVGRRHTLTGWWDYERRITPILGALGVAVLCVYDETGWRSESWRLAAEVHGYVVKDAQITLGGASAA